MKQTLVKGKQYKQLMKATRFLTYVAVALYFFLLGFSIGRHRELEVYVKTISPLPIDYVVPEVKPHLSWIGTASYYSRDGCLGCSPTLTMANGEPLDDSRLTIAMTPGDVREFKLLNRIVVVRNTKTNLQTTAKVTDTGGFAVYNRIADLSVAVKRSIQCSDLCEVEITAD